MTRRHWIALALMGGLFLLVRSWRLTLGFHFLYDQALFSYQALEIWQNKTLTLIGPPTSWHAGGRYIFQGSAIYYLWLLFLLGARFDPYLATWLYMFFACLMLVPLYIGVKSLINARSAVLVCLFYIFYPTAIIATSELWNPHFQFALLPGLIYLFSRYKTTERIRWLFLTGLMAGLLLQFHYQFVLVIFGLGLWCLSRLNYRVILGFVSGFALGFSPLILFELRNDWYNLRTAVLLLKNSSEVFAGQSGLPYHYLLSLASLLLIVGLSFLKHRIKPWHVVVIGMMLALSTPLTLSRIAKVEHDLAWSYLDEVKVYQIIRAQGLPDYNVTAFYQGIATPQRYLHLLDGIRLPDDYYHNSYLFVIYPDESYTQNSAYEMNSFTPATTLAQWRINTVYNLYLLKRQAEVVD